MATSGRTELDLVADALAQAVYMVRGHRGLARIAPRADGGWLARLRIKTADDKELPPGFYAITRKGKKVEVELLPGKAGKAMFDMLSGAGQDFRIEWG